MKIYINGTGNVSPQKTWVSAEFLDEVKEYNSRMMQCLEPEIDPGLDEKYLRRMSRMIRLGWLAAKICLDEAENRQPDAIITGSGWGSIQDSEKFLLSIYKNHENLLPPTPFIQSTHNAVGAQVAMLLNNSSYNMTYAHNSFAFEHALLDALLRMKTGDSHHVLLGGIDEITANQFILTDRLHRWRRQDTNNMQLFDHQEEGTIAGEGFTFFFLQNRPAGNTYAEVIDLMTLYSMGSTEMVAASVLSWLKSNGLEPGMIDWVFTGFNGDKHGDAVYREVLSKAFPAGCNLAAWKHLSGEYLTSAAFASWAAAKALQRQLVPEILRITETGNRNIIKNILVYNHFKGQNHSFILLSSAK